MDNESANYYTREVMVILIREFQSPDEEMKKIVLKVIKLSLNAKTFAALLPSAKVFSVSFVRMRG